MTDFERWLKTMKELEPKEISQMQRPSRIEIAPKVARGPVADWPYRLIVGLIVLLVAYDLWLVWS